MGNGCFGFNSSTCMLINCDVQVKMRGRVDRMMSSGRMYEQMVIFFEEEMNVGIRKVTIYHSNMFYTYKMSGLSFPESSN